jgi:hypothetical protein
MNSLKGLMNRNSLAADERRNRDRSAVPKGSSALSRKQLVTAIEKEGLIEWSDLRKSAFICGSGFAFYGVAVAAGLFQLSLVVTASGRLPSGFTRALTIVVPGLTWYT